MKHNFSFGKTTRDWLIMLAGTFLSAAGTSMFFTPCKIVDGGITSVSTIL